MAFIRTDTREWWTNASSDKCQSESGTTIYTSLHMVSQVLLLDTEWRAFACIIHERSPPTARPQRDREEGVTFHYVQATWTNKDRAHFNPLTTLGWLAAGNYYEYEACEWKEAPSASRVNSMSDCCATRPQADKRPSLMTSTFFHN